MQLTPKDAPQNCYCSSLPNGYGKCGPCQQWAKLPALRQAIIDHTRHEDMFWLGEILLSELAKETGYPPDHSSTPSLQSEP